MGSARLSLSDREIRVITMALTEAQKLARAGKLTASRVACLMTGDKAKIMAVWRELCGDPTYQEENLDDVWAVQLGSLTESLNLDWYEKIKNKTLTRRGEVIVSPQYEVGGSNAGWI